MFDLSKFSRTPLSENFCECCKPSEKTSLFTNKNMFSMKEFDRERDRSNKKEVFIFENYTEKKNYKKFGYFNLFEFNIKEEEIRFVDGNNEEIFNEALSFISFQKILSIDTEHYKEPTNKLKTGTIQISTSKYIYIFDILMIVNCQKWEIFIEKLDSVMKAENILKIFYEPIQDLKILNYTVNYKYFRKFNRVIDLSEVKHEFLEKIYHIKIKGLKVIYIIYIKNLKC